MKDLFAITTLFIPTLQVPRDEKILLLECISSFTNLNELFIILLYNFFFGAVKDIVFLRYILIH